MSSREIPQSKTPLPPKSFMFLYRKFTLPLMKFLIKRTGGDKEAAEEVFSSTMVAAWEGMYRFRNKSSYFTWLCRIALNKLADYYRVQINHRSKFIAPALEELANISDNQLSPVEKMAILELRESVNKCVLLLPEEKRQLIYLRYWQDFTIKKIAEMMGTKERSIEGKIYRAKLELRQLIQQKYPQMEFNYNRIKD